LFFNGKVIAITGASGTMGRALLGELGKRGARLIALTTSPNVSFADLDQDLSQPIEILVWKIGHEAELCDRLKDVDILILNHGLNVLSARDSQSIYNSYEVNTFSVFRWVDLIMDIWSEVANPQKEIWVNTSEAEVNPAFSPLYELSKRAIGDLLTLRRLDCPYVIRKLVLGPFKSNLNPYGVMSASFVAWAIAAIARLGLHDIIVTINPLTFVAYPFKEVGRSLYFRLFSRTDELHK